MKNQNEKYRRTGDGTLLARKPTSGWHMGIPEEKSSKEMWYQCSEKPADRQFVWTVLGGWFGLHKFQEGKLLQGIFYLLTCGCYGVFYLCDLFAIICDRLGKETVRVKAVGEEGYIKPPVVDSARRRAQEMERKKKAEAEAEKAQEKADLQISDETKTKEQMAKNLAEKENFSAQDQTEKLGKLKVGQMKILDSFDPMYEFE